MMSPWTLVACGTVLVLAARRFALGYPVPDRRLQSLSAREYATVASAALATYPPGGAIGPSGAEAGIASYVDRFVGAQQPSTRLLMRLLFVLVEHGTLLFPAPGRHGRRRFTRLSAEQQVLALESWRKSRLFPRRLVFTSLRAILTMGYFGAPAVLRELSLAPREIPRRLCEADLLWPAVGASPAERRWSRVDLDEQAQLPLAPLGPHGALHPDFVAAPPPASELHVATRAEAS